MTPSELSSSGVRASWPVCSWASADRTEPCPRFGQVRRAASFSFRQRLVGDALANGRTHETIEAFQRVPLHVAVIQPERKLVDVSAQVLAAGVVVNAEYPALHDREHALDAVGRDVAAHVFPTAVVDRFVAEEQAIKPTVSRRLVGVQRRANRNTRMNCTVYGVQVHVGNRRGNRLATALTHAEHRSLTDCAAPGIEFFYGVLVRLLAAKIGFVNFNDALQLGQIIAARLTQAMQDEPRGFLGDADLLGQLQRGNALTARYKQVHGINPLLQRNMRPLENSAGANGEILAAGIATVIAILSIRHTFATGADWAFHAVRPKARLQIEPRRFLVGEQLEKLKCADSQAVVHKSVLRHEVLQIAESLRRCVILNRLSVPVIAGIAQRLLNCRVKQFFGREITQVIPAVRILAKALFLQINTGIGFKLEHFAFAFLACDDEFHDLNSLVDLPNLQSTLYITPLGSQVPNQTSRRTVGSHVYKSHLISP